MTGAKPAVTRSIVRFYTLGIMGGDVPYWTGDSKPEMLTPRRYDVVFAKAGNGFVRLTEGKISDRIDLCSIEVGFYDERPDARSRLLVAGQRMLLRLSPGMEPEAAARAAASMIRRFSD